ncbi:MAG TPA: hypothetical protein VG982_03200, partial [Candidatus Paceibacterota bacterium]|nr:hypothetical protein [Candidatus Paceibacterota bacterium]
AIRSRLRNLKEEHATLLQKQETLQKTNDYLSTPEGQEEALREKYNVVKPGEGVVVITTPPGAENGDHTSRIAKWWDSLLHGLGVRK